jgi:N-acetylneuraminic acid mutarotase
LAATKSITTFLYGALACALVSACGCAAESSAFDASTGDGPARIDGGSSDSWTTLAPVPQAVQETAVVELDGIIYVLGGFDVSGTTLNRVSAYEVATNTWSNVAPLPLAVHHVNAAVVGGKIYVVGSLEANFSSHGGVWEFDPSQNAWTTLSDMPAGTERGSSAVGVIDGTIYLAGGFRSLGSVSDVSSYTPSSQQWNTTLDDLPTALNHLAGQAVGGKFYVLGGRTVGIGDIVGEVQVYDPALASWSAGAPMPTARGGMASGVVDGRIVLVGGEGNTNVSSGVFPQVEVYDPQADSWAALPDMVTPRHGMGAVGYQGSLYVPGGATVQGYGATEVHESLRL